MNRTTRTTRTTRSNRTSRSLPALATVMAGTALAVAVGGGGVAVASGLARDSVDSRHLKDGSVRGVDVADGTLTGADVRESTLGTVNRAHSAERADQAQFAGHAETADRLLNMVRVTVSATGELRPSIGPGAVSAAQTDTPGRYVVHLGTPSLGCFLVPAVAHNSADPVAGSASAWFTPPLQQTFGTQVTVETHAPDGDEVPDPLPFNLLVLC